MEAAFPIVSAASVGVSRLRWRFARHDQWRAGEACSQEGSYPLRNNVVSTEGPLRPEVERSPWSRRSRLRCGTFVEWFLAEAAFPIVFGRFVGVSRLRWRFARHDQWLAREACSRESHLVSAPLDTTTGRAGEACPQEQATPLRTNVVSPPHRRLPRSRPGDGNRQNPQRTAASLRSTPTRFVKLVSKQPRGDDCTCSRVPQGALLALRHTKLSHPHPPKTPQQPGRVGGADRGHVLSLVLLSRFFSRRLALW